MSVNDSFVVLPLLPILILLGFLLRDIMNLFLLGSSWVVWLAV
jgi:hypothetical protein